ncbi:MAG: alpha/beta fold hydrolase [Alkalilacustris sp.]
MFADVAGGPEGGRAFWLRTADGVRLRAGLWAEGRRGTVLLFPGRTEVVEKYGTVAADLAAAGWGVLTLDWRGQGLSDRLGPDPALGHVRRFAEYQADTAALVAAAGSLGLARPWMALAHSMGGCIALRALVGQGRTGQGRRVQASLPVSAVAFSAPMWGLPLGRGVRLVLRASRLALQLGRRDGRAVPGERDDFALATASFDDNFLTTDRAEFDRMQAQVRRHPELALGAPTLGWLAAALDEMAALARLPSPSLPAFAGVGGREKIVAPDAIATRMAGWQGGRHEVFPGAEHELMMEAPTRRRHFLQVACALFDAAAARPDTV